MYFLLRHHPEGEGGGCERKITGKRILVFEIETNPGWILSPLPRASPSGPFPRFLPASPTDSFPRFLSSLTFLVVGRDKQVSAGCLRLQGACTRFARDLLHVLEVDGGGDGGGGGRSAVHGSGTNQINAEGGGGLRVHGRGTKKLIRDQSDRRKLKGKMVRKGGRGGGKEHGHDEGGENKKQHSREPNPMTPFDVGVPLECPGTH